MDRDSLILMLFSWGLAMGLQAFCLIMMARHPEAAEPFEEEDGDP